MARIRNQSWQSRTNAEIQDMEQGKGWTNASVVGLMIVLGIVLLFVGAIIL